MYRIIVGVKFCSCFLSEIRNIISIFKLILIIYLRKERISIIEKSLTKPIPYTSNKTFVKTTQTVIFSKTKALIICAINSYRSQNIWLFSGFYTRTVQLSLGDSNFMRVWASDCHI